MQIHVPMFLLMLFPLLPLNVPASAYHVDSSLIFKRGFGAAFPKALSIQRAGSTPCRLLIYPKTILITEFITFYPCVCLPHLMTSSLKRRNCFLFIFISSEHYRYSVNEVPWVTEYILNNTESQPRKKYPLDSHMHGSLDWKRWGGSDSWKILKTRVQIILSFKVGDK